MVGGSIIEIMPYRLDGVDVMRLWVIDSNYNDECIVYAAPFERDDGPDIGETIWWQDGKIFYDGDRLFLKKIGYSESI